ncbi:MAG: hypothetical protein K9J13_11330 [Saprospiraceae bacterium]|nr:hypothetical protein [Saprospiraceae bacterium]
MKKITPREFIEQKFPNLKATPTNELNKVIGGDTILSLMEEYYMYRITSQILT